MTAGPGLVTSIDPIRVLRRYLWLLFAAGVFGVAVGVVAFFLLDRYYPLFAGQAVFEIQPGLRDSREIGTHEITSDDLVVRLANTEAQLLLSRTILSDAVAHPDILGTVWHRQFIDEHGVFDMEDAVDDLVASLNASVVRGTNFFQLRWRTGHAGDVPIVLNTIANAYIERRKTIDEEDWNQNLDLFTNELRETDRNLDDLEQDIRQFIRDRGLTTLDHTRYHQTAVAAESLTREMSKTNSSLNLARGALMQTGAKLLGTLEPTPEDLHEAQMDHVVGAQLRLVTQLRTALRHAREKYNEGHITLREIRGRLDAAELELEAKTQEVIKRNLESRYKRLQNEVAQLTQHLEKLQDEADVVDDRLRDLAADMAQYQHLETRRQRLEGERETDLDLIKQLHLMKARADATRVRLAQRAERPRGKAFPKVFVVVPLSTLLILGLAVGLVFLRELTDHRIKGASDLSVMPSAKVLGVIPELDEDPTRTEQAEMVIRRHPVSVMAESYRQACTAILNMLEHHGHQSLLLLGGLPASGTTTAATNIAASIAATGKSVVVVDANFRRPRLVQAMGLPAVAGEGPGLGDLLNGSASIDEALVSAGDGVHVIGPGTPGNRVFERLHNGLFDSIVSELRGRFDVIIFDAPPAVVAGDAMVLANRVDAAVLVVRAHQEQRGLVARLLAQLGDARCEALGVLLNRPRRTAGGYFKKNFETMAEYSARK